MKKKLYKNAEDKILCGVISGLAEYLEIDVTLLRVGFAVLSLFAPTIPVYIVCALVMPKKPQFPESPVFTQEDYSSCDK